MITGCHVLFCRPQYESVLADELATKQDGEVRFEEGTGYVVTTAVPVDPCIFERQRMLDAIYLPASALNPLDKASILPLLDMLEGRKWILFAVGENSRLQKQGEGLARAFTSFSKKACCAIS